MKSYSSDVHLVGHIFFHLVESKKEGYPFAFLATYSTDVNKQGDSKHIPLKYALQEFGSDSEKLLDLLSTVNIAAKESPLISGLIESGELFHPLSWSAKEAFTFLKETPLYERSGILCRIPNWSALCSTFSGPIVLRPRAQEVHDRGHDVLRHCVELQDRA